LSYSRQFIDYMHNGIDYEYEYDHLARQCEWMEFPDKIRQASTLLVLVGEPAIMFNRNNSSKCRRGPVGEIPQPLSTAVKRGSSVTKFPRSFCAFSIGTPKKQYVSVLVMVKRERRWRKTSLWPIRELWEHIVPARVDADGDCV